MEKDKKQKVEDIKREIVRMVAEENCRLKEQHKGLPGHFGEIFLEFDEKAFLVRTVPSKEGDVKKDCDNFSVCYEEIVGKLGKANKVVNKKNILNSVKGYIEKFRKTNIEQIDATKRIVQRVQKLNEVSSGQKVSDFKLTILVERRVFDNSKNRAYSSNTSGS